MFHARCVPKISFSIDRRFPRWEFLSPRPTSVLLWSLLGKVISTKATKPGRLARGTMRIKNGKNAILCVQVNPNFILFCVRRFWAFYNDPWNQLLSIFSQVGRGMFLKKSSNREWRPQQTTETCESVRDKQRLKRQKWPLQDRGGGVRDSDFPWCTCNSFFTCNFFSW